MRCTHRTVIGSTRQITTLVLGTDQGGKNVRDQTTTAFWSRPHIAGSNTFWNIIDPTERRIRNVRDPYSRKDSININKKNSSDRSVNDNYLSFFGMIWIRIGSYLVGIVNMFFLVRFGTACRFEW